jgi:L-gulonate 3-dehydrogenase
MTPVRKVAVIGTGLIGRGWAAAFAKAGWRVSLWDQSETAARDARLAVRRALEDMENAGLTHGAETNNQNVTVAANLSEALADADYAQESVPERAEIKRDIFAAMDKVAPNKTLLASSSSTIAGSIFLDTLPGRARAIVAHPSNPPHLMPVVEIVPSPWHDASIVARCIEILSSIGQVPVVVKKEIEGFVLNRLQAAVVNEAVALVGLGVIDPDGLDAVMKHGLGLRWSMMGPFETMDLNAPNGFLDYGARYGHLYQAMGRGLHVADAWRPEALETIEEARRADTPMSRVADRMRWRDQMLMKLLKLKEDSAVPESK